MKKLLCSGLAAAIFSGAAGLRATDPEPHSFAEALVRAERGELEAMGEVGRAYATGEGTAKNPVTALEWYRKAADERLGAESSAAALAAAQMFEKGEGTKRDLLWALHYYLLAAADDEGAMATAKRLAAADPKLAKQLRTIAPRDTQAFLVAAEKGEESGRYYLAELLIADGGGLMPDLEQGVRMIQQLADQGYAKAQAWMGLAYGETELLPTRPDGGRFFPADAAKALSWLKKAAAQGHPEACNLLAAAYASGEGMEKDFKEAYRLYDLAAKGSVEYAEGLRDRLAAEHPEVVPGYVAPAAGAAVETRNEVAAIPAPAPAPIPTTPQPPAPVLTPKEKIDQAGKDYEREYAAATYLDDRVRAVLHLAEAYDENYEAAGMSKADATRSIYWKIEEDVRKRPIEVAYYMYWMNQKYCDWNVLSDLVVRDIGFQAMLRSERERDRDWGFRRNSEKAAKGDAQAQYELACYYLADGKDKNEELAISWLLKAVAAGSQSAVDEAKKLGAKKYQEGLDANHANRTAESIKLFELASRLGAHEGDVSIGSSYENAWVEREPNYAKAMEWYRRAVEHGNPQGLVAQGKLYAEGHGVPKDEGQAINLYREAAEKGDTGGMLALGYAALMGRGMAADEAQARVWFKQAADKKVAVAIQWLAILEPKASPIDRAELALEHAGMTFYEDAGEIFIDPHELLDYAAFLGSPAAKEIRAKWRPPEKSAEEPPELEAAFAAQGKKNFAAALAQFRKAADKGSAYAMRSLGVYLANETPGLKVDLDEAERWFTKAGEAGLLSGWIGAYTVRGFRIYLAGEKAREAGNWAEARQQWLIAGDMGQGNALRELGYLQEDGAEGVMAADPVAARPWYERQALFDPAGGRKELKRLEGRLVGRTEYLAGVKALNESRGAEAMAAFEKAVALGNYNAMEQLAFCYEAGQGVTKDLPKAIALYEKAVALGSWTAQEALADIKSLQKAENIGAALKEAQKLADIADGKAAKDGDFESVDDAMAQLNKVANGDFAREMKEANAARDRINAAAKAAPAPTKPAEPAKPVSEGELKAKALAGDALAQLDYGILLKKKGDGAGASEWIHRAHDNPKASEEVKKWADYETMDERYAAQAQAKREASAAAKTAKAAADAKQFAEAKAATDAADKLHPADGLFHTWNTWRVAPAFRDMALKNLYEAAKVAETGSPETQYRLADFIMQGTLGVPKDEARARALLVASAQAGFAPAQLGYASALVAGRLGFAADAAKGQAMLTELVARAESLPPEAAHQVALLLFQGVMGVPVEKARGIKLLEKCADASYPLSQFEFGRALLNGLPPELPADPARGVTYLRYVANQGVPEAMGLLGQVFERGVGAVAANPQEALAWYEKADQAGLNGAKAAADRVRAQVPPKGAAPTPAAGGGK